MVYSAGELCKMLGGELEGDPDVRISKPGKIESAEEGSLSFLANPKYESHVYTTKASVLLVDKDFKPRQPVHATLIRVDDVYTSLGTLLNSMSKDEQYTDGISGLASVHGSVSVGSGASVGEFAVVRENSRIGKQSIVFPNVYIGENVTIGDHTRIYPGARVFRDTVIGNNCVIQSNSVIGGEGFGFARGDNGEFSKIAQVGNVIIEDNVEIGACTTIDRATMGSTIIRKGVKLDNLIMIAHNVEVGENSAMAAQSGVAGSARIGKNVLVGGQAGFAGHIEVADGSKVQAQTGVNKSLEDKDSAWIGSPVMHYVDYLRSYSVFTKLPGIEKKIAELEMRLNKLDDSTSE